MNNPIPQTQAELERECFGTIAGVARDIERAAMNGDAATVNTHFDFLKKQINRLDVIRTTARQAPRTI